MYWLTKALSRNPRWPSEMRAKHMRGVWCCVLEVRGGAHHISRKHSSPSSWRPKERSKQSGSCTHQLLMRRAGARHHQQDRSTARGSNQRHQRHQRRFLSVGRARLSKRSLNFIERGSTLGRACIECTHHPGANRMHLKSFSDLAGPSYQGRETRAYSCT